MAATAGRSPPPAPVVRVHGMPECGLRACWGNVVSNSVKGAGKSADGPTRLVRLAERSLPRRVRFLLDGLLERTVYFESALGTLCTEVEQRLFKQADNARSNEQQARLFEAIREIKRGKADIAPRFLMHLESSLATFDQAPGEASATSGSGRGERHATKLELVDSRDLEITLAIQEIGNRAEIRHTGALYLLGHRMGLVAGRAAFESDEVPLGPVALARALQHALLELDLEQVDRIQVFHDFDSIVMGPIGQFYETINRYLAEQGILPGLQAQLPKTSPHRASAAKSSEENASPDEAKPTEDSAGSQPTPAGATAKAGAPMGAAPMGAAPMGAAPMGAAPMGAAPMGAAPMGAAPMGGTPRMGSPMGGTPAGGSHSGQGSQTLGAGGLEGAGAEGGDSEMFSSLRGLLAARRRALNIKPSTPSASSYMASRQDLQSVLGNMQQGPTGGFQQGGKAVTRTISHLKQDLLTQLRTASPDGQTPVIAEEDSDTIDLVGMLFDYINDNLSSHHSSRDLIAKLQVPILRSAIGDKHFFTRRNHPARQLLNSVAEATATWMSDDEADSGMVDTMTAMVDRVTHEFNGDMSLMESLLGDLGRYMSQVTKRAEIAERRHIDAAKGRDRLETSRQQANAAITRLLKRGNPAPMVRAVLEQAWTDVLALNLLRHGEESQSYRRSLAVADQLMQIGTGADIAKVDKKVRDEVRSGLLQVGLHDDEVEGVLGKLFDPGSVEKKTSHTEIAVALKSKARLGTDSTTQAKPGEPATPPAPATPLNAEEKDMVQRIRTLPFGTWFEFVTNQQGKTVRRKLAWFSTVTGRCLFVNQRGARADEKTIDQLARDLVRGQVRIEQRESESFIDRAWKAIKQKLQDLSSPTSEVAPA